MSLFTNGMIMFVDYPKVFIDKLLGEFSDAENQLAM